MFFFFFCFIPLGIFKKNIFFVCLEMTFLKELQFRLGGFGFGLKFSKQRPIVMNNSLGLRFILTVWNQIYKLIIFYF